MGDDQQSTGSATGDQAARTTSFPRIEAHGLIGDLATAALVGTNGSIDFMCWPKLDSASIFAALLDPETGGDFSVEPEMRDAETRQLYWPDSNVLSTRWVTPEASLECTDLMVLGDTASPPRLLRRFQVLRGQARVRVTCRPRFDYGTRDADVRVCPAGLRLSGAEGDPVLRLRATVPLRALGNAAEATMDLEPGREGFLLLDDMPDAADDARTELDAGELSDLIARTDAFWRAWTDKSTYRGRWREPVARSALALKLLTSREHGSIAAAATFGLPERPGGDLNWDYRATWIRDASFTTYALMRLGYGQEANAFMRWSSARASEAGDPSRLKIMYRLDGTSDLAERTLEHLRGYGGAAPVRIGNAAADQRQLDIYGELLDSVYVNAKYGEPPNYDGWRQICGIVDYACDHWGDRDAGIWESRGEPQHFLHSRLMCWVAVDRALRLATKRSLPAPYERWTTVRNDIYGSIWTDFWDEDRGHFVHAKGSADLDGAMLLMPLVRFVTGTDPRWLKTLDAITVQLVDDGLVFRTPEGRSGHEGAFAACSFWYVECLTRAGRVEMAHREFERALSYGNHLGLFAEEFDVQAHHLGNFPQALTHLALISAAYSLDRELSGQPVLR